MTAAQDPSTSAAPEISHLQSSFLSRPLSSHPAIWDKHWKDSFSPWDRGGPSLALDDLLTNHRELFPSVKSGGPKPRALVPGCGRGHDVLLLSAFGYDVTGLDVSEAGLLEAAENQRLNGGEPVYAARNREGAVTEKGSVAWMKADFFDEQNSSLESGSFDLIYDYTFFCALPPEGRPKWAKRMAQLLKPDGGRLVCLEWPLAKPFASGGPPWGVTPEAYAAHLSHPGEELEYNENGLVDRSVPTTPNPSGALHRLARIKPARTHKSGTDESGDVIDFISVWSHAS